MINWERKKKKTLKTIWSKFVSFRDVFSRILLVLSDVPVMENILTDHLAKILGPFSPTVCLDEIFFLSWTAAYFSWWECWYFSEINFLGLVSKTFSRFSFVLQKIDVFLPVLCVGILLLSFNGFCLSIFIAKTQRDGKGNPEKSPGNERKLQTDWHW